ncbi:MAG TPA: DUF6364 family protein [Rhodospirillales bacterium]
MRTTIRLDDRLLVEAKAYAAKTGRTLTGLIEDALRQVLDHRRRPGGARRIKLKTVHGTGVQPGIDLDDSAALEELMDRRE